MRNSYPPVTGSSPSRTPRNSQSAKVALLILAIAVPVVLLFRFWGDKNPTESAPYAVIFIQLVKIGLLIGCVALIIWMIRRGVAQGMGDHERNQKK